MVCLKHKTPDTLIVHNQSKHIPNWRPHIRPGSPFVCVVGPLYEGFFNFGELR